MDSKTSRKTAKDTPTTPKKKRGSKSASITANCTASTSDISRIVKTTYYYFNFEIVKSDDECAERLNFYFSHVAETGEIPTVETMCLCLGTTRRTVWGWEQGTLGAVRSNMIKKAKQILAANDAILVSEGKIPQVTYIFRSKNFYGMTDQQQIVVTPNNPLGDAADAEKLKQKYLENAEGQKLLAEAAEGAESEISVSADTVKLIKATEQVS